jgi:hypothetical protein
MGLLDNCLGAATLGGVERASQWLAGGDPLISASQRCAQVGEGARELDLPWSFLEHSDRLAQAIDSIHTILGQTDDTQRNSNRSWRAEPTREV